MRMFVCTNPELLEDLRPSGIESDYRWAGIRDAHVRRVIETLERVGFDVECGESFHDWQGGRFHQFYSCQVFAGVRVAVDDAAEAMAILDSTAARLGEAALLAAFDADCASEIEDQYSLTSNPDDSATEYTAEQLASADASNRAELQRRRNCPVDPAWVLEYMTTNRLSYSTFGGHVWHLGADGCLASIGAATTATAARKIKDAHKAARSKS